MRYMNIIAVVFVMICSSAIASNEQRIYIVENYLEKNAERCLINNSDQSGWLYANRWIGAGSFAIGAMVKIERAGGCFEMGRNKEGVIFGDENGDVVIKFGYPLQTIVLGAFEDIVPDDYFFFGVRKDRLSVEYFINDKKITSCEFIEDYTENVGFYITNGCISVRDFWLSGDIRKYQSSYNWFYDDFENDQAGNCPDNWYTPYTWLEPGRDWVVELDEGNKFLRHKMASNAYTVLHGFGRDSILEASFKVNEAASNSGIWFALRHNLDPSYLVRCGYDFARESWVIEENFGLDDFQYEVSRKMPLELNKWYNIRLEAWGEAIVIYLNGNKITNSNMLMNNNYGRAALYADNIDAGFDNIRYRSEGQVQLGVETHTLRARTMNLYRPNDDVLACKVERGWTYLSEDRGLSWKRAQTDCPDMNCIKLANGILLSLKRHFLPDARNVRYAAHISQDEGLSWSQPYWLHDQSGFRIAMNGKLSQSKNGRIFFVCSSTKEMVEDDGSIYAEKVGGVDIYISDDNGKNWQMLKRLDFDSTGLNLQEALVVSQNDGK